MGILMKFSARNRAIWVAVLTERRLGHGVAESPLARESRTMTTALGFVYRF
jgi:outer membrane scaffolding protein for murein synthesis (MipA/OmpV family)